MKLSSARRILLEELPAEVRKWFTTIIDIVNPFLEQTYRILTQGITIGDNLKSQKITIDVQVSQVYPVRVAYTLNERPYAVLVAQIYEATSSTAVVQNHSFNWYYENGTLLLYFSGLDTAKAYKANLFTMI